MASSCGLWGPSWNIMYPWRTPPAARGCFGAPTPWTARRAATTTGPGMGRSWRALCTKWKGPDGWNVAGGCAKMCHISMFAHFNFFLFSYYSPVISGFHLGRSIPGKEVKQHGGSWKACKKDQWMPFRHAQYYLQEAWRMVNHQWF